MLKGEAKLLFEGETQPVHLKPGDHLTIPAHRRHRVAWTTPREPTIWLAEVISVADNTFSEGNPGIGFNYGVGETNRDFGFTSFGVESYDD